MVLEETLDILKSVKAKMASTLASKEDRNPTGFTELANMFEVQEIEDVGIKLSDLQFREEPVTSQHVVKICEPEIDITDLFYVSISIMYCHFTLILECYLSFSRSRDLCEPH